MASYGEVALKAVGNYRSHKVTPREAWVAAACEVFTSEDSQKKCCPRSTFLALCEEGLVIGVPNGKYCNAKENKKYALEAVAILKNSPEKTYNESSLWRAVTEGKKKYNQQMDVVLSLWNQGYIIR